MIRVLHCPTATAGHAATLARAEREIGLDSAAVVFRRSSYDFGGTEVLFDGRMGRARREAIRWRLLGRAILRADVVHFNFGATIMPQLLPAENAESSLKHILFRFYCRVFDGRDLAWLALLRKAVVMTFMGYDALQAGLSFEPGDHRILDELGPNYFNPAGDRAKRRRIRRADRFAHRIHATTPDLLRTLPSRTTLLPQPELLEPPAGRPSLPGTSEILRIVHAPTDRTLKGTRHIVAAVESLKADGLPVELRLVEGVSPAEARAEYLNADLVSDQFLTGWYGSTCVQSMALGTPVVAWISDKNLAGVPLEMARELPVISARPEHLAEVLRDWCSNRRNELPEVGRRSRAFVERWHDARSIARQLRSEYEAALRDHRRV